MNDKKVVLVTGVSGHWGAHVAAALNKEPGLHVIALDKSPPAFEIEGLDYVDAEIESSLLSEFLISEGITVICHLGFIENTNGDDRIRSVNVARAMNVLNAGMHANVNQIIIRSGTAVYGARADNPAFLREDMPLRGSGLCGNIRDWLEIEALVEGMREKESPTAIALLRFANIVGSTADSAFTRFLNQSSPRILLGFDPMLQMVHESDVVSAISFAVLNETEGVFNIAADGAMPLSRILRLVRRFPRPIFHPIAYFGSNLSQKRTGRSCEFMPIDWDYLRYPWVGDTGKMHGEMGYSPSMSSEDALLEYAGRMPSISEQPESDGPSSEEAHMREIMERRAQSRREAEAD